MKGYTGKILEVDLTKGHCVDLFVPEENYYKYLSGIGLAASLLYQKIPTGADPLGPENVLAFVSGLLTGTGSLFTGRWMAAAKSPLTGTFGDSNCGGNFSPAMKQCGYDGIFVSGISEKPVYLRISNKGAEILPADDLWGTDAISTEEILISRARGKKKPAVACIGTSGEKLSLISGICNDGGRIAARSGLGAVMGSKRLKAVVLEGTKPIASTDPEAIKRLSWKCSRKIRALPAPKGKYLAILGRLLSKLKFAPAMNGKLIATMWRRWGTSSMNQFSVELGDSPIKNWKGSSIDYPGHVSRNIDPDRIIAREKEKYHCYSCPLGCGGRCSMKHDKWKETHKPEYETIMSFGGLLLNADLDSIFYLNELLNRAGMDTISAGGTIAFAQECFEKRFITTDDTGGIDLSWGNTEGIIALVEKMVNREGIGDLLADGSRKAAEKIGQGSKDFAITAGGQELAMHDPRNDPGFGLHAGADPTPGKHSIGAQQYYELQALWKRVKTLPRVKSLISIKCKFIADKEKAVHAVANSCFSQFYNGAGLCLFAALLGVHRVPIFEWMNAATGWNRTPGEYIEVGRRIQTLKQLFNIKHGIDPLSLKPSPRSVGDPPLTQGPNKERSFDLDKMLRDYWQEIGWDRNSGNPTAETVDALGLKDIISGEKIDFTTTAIKSRMVRKSEKPPKGTKPTVNKKICVSCSTCIQACPVSCLIFRRGSGRDPHPYPELPNPKNCISCGICKQNCPVNAIVMKA